MRQVINEGRITEFKPPEGAAAVAGAENRSRIGVSESGMLVYFPVCSGDVNYLYVAARLSLSAYRTRLPVKVFPLPAVSLRVITQGAFRLFT